MPFANVLINALAAPALSALQHDFDGLISDKSETEEETVEASAEESEIKPASKRKTKKP